jgi:hypothetical protein
MDQLAGAVRNIESKRIGETVSTNDQLGIPVLSRNPSSSPKPSLAAYWHDRVDPDYRNRPATGNLFYRASDGSLVDLPFVGLGGLGNLLADQDDLYRCITKRYYEFFIGVKVPMSFTAENLAQDPHRATINNLALELKDHGSLKKTIYEIIKSTEYRKK